MRPSPRRRGGGRIGGRQRLGRVSTWFRGLLGNLLMSACHAGTTPLSDCRTPRRGFRAASLHYTSNFAMQSTTDVARLGPLAPGQARPGLRPRRRNLVEAGVTSIRQLRAENTGARAIGLEWAAVQA